MARVTWYDHANLMLDGQLDQLLKGWQHDEHLTIDQIARRLDDRGVEVSRETVRRWLLDAKQAS